MKYLFIIIMKYLLKCFFQPVIMTNFLNNQTHDALYPNVEW